MDFYNEITLNTRGIWTTFNSIEHVLEVFLLSRYKLHDSANNIREYRQFQAFSLCKPVILEKTENQILLYVIFACACEMLYPTFTTMGVG